MSRSSENDATFKVIAVLTVVAVILMVVDTVGVAPLKIPVIIVAALLAAANYYRASYRPYDLLSQGAVKVWVLIALLYAAMVLLPSN